MYDFPPPWVGLAPFGWELTKAQVEAGHEVTVICGNWRNARPPLPKLPSKLSLVRIPREPFSSTLFLSSAVLAYFQILKEVRTSKFDAILGHGQLPMYYHLHRLILGRFLTSNYFLTLHVTAAGRRRNALGEKLGLMTKIEWYFHELSDRWGVRIAQHIFVTGENVKDEVVEFYKADPNKITVLENGVDFDIFKPGGKSVNQEYKLKTNEKVILFVGVHNNRKGLDKLIQSLKLLPTHYKLLTVGSGSEDDLQLLNRLVEDNNLTDRVIFAGPHPYPIPDYYHCADVTALPSQYEGFPKVVLESLACGVPVLASGFKVINPPKGLKIIKHPDPKLLAEGVLDLVRDHHKVDLSAVRSRYSWKAMALRIDLVVKSF